MRAAVGEPEHGARVEHHLADRLEVAVDVVRERREQELLAVALEQPVERDLLGPAPLALGGGRDALLRGRLVVGRIAEREDPAPVRHQHARDRVARRRLLGEELRAQRRVAELPDALRERQTRRWRDTKDG